MKNLDTKPSLALLALGSNLGDREKNFRQAIQYLNLSCGTVINKSPNYVTRPIGRANQVFLNGTVLLQTHLKPACLLAEIKSIEKKLGREQASGKQSSWKNRTMDIDILLVKDSNGCCVVHRSKELDIPHPEIKNRDFVLIPACSIAQDWVHPLHNKTLQNLLNEFNHYATVIG